jgi:hypothetical protein
MVGVLLLSSVSNHTVVVIRLDLSWLSSVSKHNSWSCRYYGWVCRCCRPSLNTICGCIMVGFCRCCRLSVNTMYGHTRIMLGLSFLSSVSKDNMWLYYGWICRCCRPSVNTICGRIMVGFVVVVSQSTQHVVVIRLDLSWLSSVSQYNMWSYYGWVVAFVVGK